MLTTQPKPALRPRLAGARGLSALCCAWSLVMVATTAAAAPPLPQRNLVVEARVVDRSAGELQSIGGGSVVIGTGGSTARGGDFGVRAGSDTQRADSVQRVMVLNGGRTTVRLSQWLPLRTAEWVWAGRGLGVGVGTVWVDIGQGMTVRPSWPGGSQPVIAEVAVESAGRSDAAGLQDRNRPGANDASVPSLALSTELALPLGEWVTVAQLSGDSSSTVRGGGVGGSGGGVVSSTRSLQREQSVQLRVTLP
jgi:hypothetical protein